MKPRTTIRILNAQPRGSQRPSRAFWRPMGRSKYRAKPTWVDGHRFPSQLEARVYVFLRGLRSVGILKSLELQPKKQLVIGHPEVGKYVGDFEVEFQDGVRLLIDAKGRVLPIYRLKKKLLEAQGIRIVEIGNRQRKKRTKRRAYD